MKVKNESEVAQSRPTLATPWTAAHQAPPSMGFSRQKCWSGVPLPSLTGLNSSLLIYVYGFPGGLVVKNLPVNAEDTGLLPESPRSPGGGHGNPLQYLAWRIPWTEEPGRL